MIFVLKKRMSYVQFMLMNKRKKVAVVVPWYGYGRRILLGISRFVHENPWWTIHLVQADSPVLDEDLKVWNPDGIISGVLDTEFGRLEQHYLRPWVSISMQPDDPDIPFVTLDEDAVSRMVADYFFDHKFCNFAFIGNNMHEFSVQRAEAYKYAVEEKGFSCSVYLYCTKIASISKKERQKADKNKAAWLRSLPKPVAVFACNDWEAFQFIQFCRLNGFRVPEDIAVMGVENDELLCNVSTPPLSSVRTPEERIGYDAAVLLEKLLNGKTLSAGEKKNFLPPSGLVIRQSSDISQVEDPIVSKSLQFIQEHISEPILVEDIINHVHISRTLLERKFRTELGRTPLAEIRRQRILRAKQYLTDTVMPVADIAESCGFSSDIRLSTVFKEITGMSPSEFRRTAQTPRSIHH